MAAALGVRDARHAFPAAARRHRQSGRRFAFPVRYRVVPAPRRGGSSSSGDVALLAPFIAAARALEGEGVAAIATSCGFLALFQGELQAALAVPIWSFEPAARRSNCRPRLGTAASASSPSTRRR